MERRISSHLASDARVVRARTISAPAPHEGLGNALRAAFDMAGYEVPEEFARLLKQLER